MNYTLNNGVPRIRKITANWEGCLGGLNLLGRLLYALSNSFGPRYVCNETSGVGEH